MSTHIPHLERSGGCTRLIVDGKPFIILGGELQNSSASDLAFMEPLWGKLAGMHCNTVLAPVAWEMIEPEEGRFDFSIVTGLLKGARAHNLKLVLLWFGTWKNAESAYVPGWVKTDQKRFPRAQIEPGLSSRSVSAFSEECCKADANAFRQLMKFLKSADAEHHTVIMVQVENETGLLRAAHDMSPAAMKAFTGSIPVELSAYLKSDGEKMISSFRKNWEACGAKTSGTWNDVFGAKAAETFMAWHIGRYVEKVCAAGKAEYPLPMFTNTWLPYGNNPGQYPSGGPTAELIGLWKAAAPDIDVLAPDIYLPDFKMVCKDFTQGGNPLLIPEASAIGGECNVFWALAEHDAICFSPFGIDSPHPWGINCDSPRLSVSYKFISELIPLICQYQGTGWMRGVLQTTEENEVIEIGKYRVNIAYQRKLANDERGIACGLIIAVGEDEYIVAGSGFSVAFESKAGGPRHVDFLSVYDGRFVNGEWKPGRLLNGDDTVHRRFGFERSTALQIRRAKLYGYD
jgi:hypothetical protein